MTLEVQSTGIESASGKRSINILFDRIMSDTEHVNRIILTSASRNIPNMIEDIDGIPVTFFSEMAKSKLWYLTMLVLRKML